MLDPQASEAVEARYAYFGKEAIVYPTALVIGEGRVHLGDHSAIDDFVFLNAGQGAHIGRYVHLACHVSVIGGGQLHIGDYGAVATGARLMTGTDSHKDGAHMSASLPTEYRNASQAFVQIDRDGFVGANAVVMPGVTLGEGAILGAGAIATKDLNPWTIYVGAPARPVGKRKQPQAPGP